MTKLNLFSVPGTTKNAETKIAAARNLIASVNDYRAAQFLEQLKQRTGYFQNALTGHQLSAKERQLIIKQYNQFAHTLHLCMTHPENASKLINGYHGIDYYAVGPIAKNNPELNSDTASFKMLIALAILGLTALIASIPTFVLNPLAGGILLVTGVALLLPAVAFFASYTATDSSALKQEEKDIFELGVALVKPAKIDEPVHANTAHA